MNKATAERFLKALEMQAQDYVQDSRWLLVNGSPTGVGKKPLRGLWQVCPNVVAIDSGLEWATKAGVRPNMIIGDMDSVDPFRLQQTQTLGVPVCAVDPVKDDTDLELALEFAAEQECKFAVVANFAGGRIDHELAAIGSMGAANFKVVAVDDNCAIWFLSARGQSAGFESLKLAQLGLCPADEFSIIAYDGAATLTQTGVYYPQEQAELQGMSGRGISNAMVDTDAQVTIHSGKAMLIQSF